MKSIFLFVTAIFLSVCSYSQTDTIRKVRITELPNSITTDPDSMYVPVVYNGVNYKARGWIFGAKNLDSVVVIKTNCVTITQYWDGGSIRTSDTAFKPSGIISGGTYTRLNDTIFRIAATNFLLNCRSYTVTEQNVVLNGNSDSSTGRIDVIGVDTTGNPFIKQGVNSPYPAPEQINPLKEIGLLTVSFPPNSDYGITNIYNVTNVNGIDSGALRTVVQVDSFTIAICNLRGECTNITRIFEAPRYVDSSRLSNDSVYHRINNAWIYQYKINPAGSGSGDTLNASINPWANNKKFFRHLAGVIRATASGNNQPITWAFLDTTTAHTQIAFDSVKGSGNEIRVFYPKVKNVNALVVTPDETLAGAGVICGSSVGDSSAVIFAYITTLNCGQLTGNTSSWTNGSVSLSGLSYNTSTGLTVFSPTTGGTGTIYASSPEILGAQITYVGSGNKRVRRVYSGLSGQTIGFYLVDSANVIITGNLAATDIVAISVPRTRVVPLPAQTTSSNGFPSDIFTSTANFWIIASMELYMIGYPLPGTGRVKLEWQTAKTGSANYATSYRITRAPMSSPNTETDIFSGFGFGVVDSGLTANTQYMYRMYATILGTERLITNEKVITNP